MAGFIPGLLPTNHSQEKQFAQAYEDVLERYKGIERLGRPESHTESVFMIKLRSPDCVDLLDVFSSFLKLQCDLW
ncbi:hypothetical protein ILYODFUR_006301 [Ilyodon furcidens]|uniref:Uncharacterized protein n=1 Tax=Ilyodon furcidens TaxID=33524 RepID=A0ABV0TGF2_9TELE